jgi:Zn-dependent protease with chaperone function
MLSGLSTKSKTLIIVLFIIQISYVFIPYRAQISYLKKNRNEIVNYWNEQGKNDVDISKSVASTEKALVSRYISILNTLIVRVLRVISGLGFESLSNYDWAINGLVVISLISEWFNLLLNTTSCMSEKMFVPILEVTFVILVFVSILSYFSKTVKEYGYEIVYVFPLAVQIIVMSGIYFEIFNVGNFIEKANWKTNIIGPALQESIANLLAKTGMENVTLIISEDGTKYDDSMASSFLTINHKIVKMDLGILKKFDDSVFLSVLSHELGHIKHYDTGSLILMRVLISALFIGLALTLFTYLKKDYKMPLVLMCLNAVLGPVYTTFNFILLAIQRKNEYRADKFAAEVSNAASLIKFLIFATPFDSTYDCSIFFSFILTHPSNRNRIERLKI